MLVLDVYSVKVPSDVVQEKAFALWAKSLKAGGSLHEHSPVIHAVYRLDRAVSTDKHYRTGEGNEEQISLVGRVEPEKGGAEYKVEFSELGRPPAYSGKTEFKLEPGERRVLRLPVITQGDGQGNLETVAVIWTPGLSKDQNGHSRFEVH